MRRLVILCLLAALLICAACPAAAADGQVIYADGADEFIFLPGSAYSPTDLFPNFKDVMPGDTIEQRISVRNDRTNHCKIKVYMRALGGHEDSYDFLSQLKLTVKKNTDTIMFDASADQSAQLTEWVYLGTLYSGGECELLVTLEVPVTLDNTFKHLVGYLDWEFAVEELPVDDDDPIPDTGDDSRLGLWISLAAGSGILLILLILFRPRRKED